jgi:hypothetical protein
MLYRLLKNVCQSLRVLVSVSDKVEWSGTQSSGFKEDFPSARFGSFPANTGYVSRRSDVAQISHLP